VTSELNQSTNQLKTWNTPCRYRVLFVGAAISGSLQEAQLPQRNSASVAHVYLGWLTDRVMHIIKSFSRPNYYYRPHPLTNSNL